VNRCVFDTRNYGLNAQVVNVSFTGEQHLCFYTGGLRGVSLAIWELPLCSEEVRFT
jgi:hypothetical protein